MKMQRARMLLLNIVTRTFHEEGPGPPKDWFAPAAWRHWLRRLRLFPLYNINVVDCLGQGIESPISCLDQAAYAGYVVAKGQAGFALLDEAVGL